jgi:acyl-coenzyme A thioesterase PaaI-like protein
MPETAAPLALLRGINASAAFNRWCGIEVLSAGAGRAEIALDWRADFGQYAGFLHAGMVGALIDTACGFAAVTLVGRVLAAHYSVNCRRRALHRPRPRGQARPHAGVHVLRTLRCGRGRGKAGRHRRDAADAGEFLRSAADGRAGRTPWTSLLLLRCAG